MNINRVVLTGNLTQDPELRSLPSGTTLCRLRIASNTRRKGADGNWADKPNYFDVQVWGAQAEACGRYLAKGRAVAVDGRLEWREFDTRDGQKRQAIEIVADTVQFLSDDGGSNAPSNSPEANWDRQTERPAAAERTTGQQSERPSKPPDDDDIPF